MIDNFEKVKEMFYFNEANDIADRMIPAIVAEFPTKSGVHLITRPFNLKEFHDTFPDVDVHKNSMGTVLYIPDSLEHRYVCSECWCEKHTKLKEV